MPDSQPDALLYARLLKCKGMGHALWYPGPNDHLAQQSYKDTGIRIGDLGVIRRNGTFDFLWNIAAPEDDPVNIHEPPQPTPKLPPGEIFPVPDQTSYISESEETVSQYAEVERGLTTSAPSGVAPGAAQVRESVFRLKTYESKAAFLHLPHGSEMTDLADLGTAENFLQKHAHTLFSYATEDRGRKRDHHGEPLQVTIVTGYHKTTHWGMMVLNRKSRLASGALSVEFPLPPAQVEANAAYGFSKTIGNFPGATSMRRGPDRPGLRNQSVFVRGFHIMSRRFMFGLESRKKKEKVTPTASRVVTIRSSRFLYDDYYPAEPFDDLATGVFSLQTQAETTKTAGTDFTLNDLVPALRKGNTENTLGADGQKPETSSELKNQDVNTAQTSKNLREHWHPTSLINEFIHQQVVADVAFTHDDVWMSVIEPGEHHVSNVEILARVKRRFTPVTVARILDPPQASTKVAWLEETAAFKARNMESMRSYLEKSPDKNIDIATEMDSWEKTMKSWYEQETPKHRLEYVWEVYGETRTYKLKTTPP